MFVSRIFSYRAIGLRHFRGSSQSNGVWSLFRKGQMQGAARTGAERTESYVSTGSAAATPQMAFHGQAPSGIKNGPVASDERPSRLRSARMRSIFSPVRYS